MSVLVVAEHLRGEVREVTLELITAGRGLGPVTVAVIARDPVGLVGAVAVEGVEEVVAVEVATDEFDSDVYREALTALVAARRPRATLLGFTVNSMSYAPAVAVRLGLGFASDVHHVAVEDGSVVAARSFYASKVAAELEFPDTPGVLLLLRPARWEAAAGAARPEVTSFAVTAQPSRTRHVEFVDPPPSAGVDIVAAPFLLSIGRGVGEQESVERFEELAQAMGATLAASRPLVDAGWVPSTRQVGQSGKTVTPLVYLAFGISGAIQHLAGMKSAATIIAVNSDPEAPIFDVAHFGACADLFDVADELEKLY